MRMLLLHMVAALVSMVGMAGTGVHALVPGVARQAIEFPEDLVLTRGEGEPEFTEHAITTCTVNREKGFSLRTPGYAAGMPSVNFVTAPASYINASAVVCHLARSTNATGFPVPTPAITASLVDRTPSPPCCQTCGVSSCLRAARVRGPQARGTVRVLRMGSFSLFRH